MEQTFEARFLSARRAVIAARFQNLNEMQREGVLTTQGPLLLLAGAGSGKTTVLINRIANLISAGRTAEACAVAAQRMRAAGAGKMYLPDSFDEAVRGIQPLPLLVSLLVPIRSKELLQHHLELPLQS